MKKILLLLLVTPCLCLGENENLFKNSDMKSSSGWSGDRKFEEVEGNRVLAVTARKNKEVSFSQDVDTRDIKDLVLKFRYKSADYAGRGFIIRGQRVGGGSTYTNRTLKVDGQWHELTWTFTSVRGNNQLTFAFELLDGAGTVLFDDIVIEPKAVPTTSPSAAK